MDGSVVHQNEPARSRALHAPMRPYEVRDIPKIVEIVKRELPLTPNYKAVPVHPERVEQMLLNNVNGSAFTVYVLDGVGNEKGEIVGLVAAYCGPGMFSFHNIAFDVFLWIKPNYRSLHNVGQLIAGYKQWAMYRKAIIIGASFTGGVKPELMDKLLKWHGFVPVGSIYHLNNWHGG